MNKNWKTDQEGRLNTKRRAKIICQMTLQVHKYDTRNHTRILTVESVHLLKNELCTDQSYKY